MTFRINLSKSTSEKFSTKLSSGTCNEIDLFIVQYFHSVTLKRETKQAKQSFRSFIERIVFERNMSHEITSKRVGIKKGQRETINYFHRSSR